MTAGQLAVAALLALAPVTAAPVAVAQDETIEPPPAAAPGAATDAPAAVVRALDRLSGEVEDIEIPVGGHAVFGLIDISVIDCRFPTGNPAGDAYAYVVVNNLGQDAPVFAGWMIASSPALDALDHPRYDVWVRRCTTS